MKFQHLPLQARFRYEGRVYVKTGPLTAMAADGGGQRLIPRYAVLEPLPEDLPAGAAAVAPAGLAAAAEELLAACAQLIDAACHTPQQRAALRAELEAAGQRFRAALGLPMTSPPEGASVPRGHGPAGHHGV